MYKKSFSVYLGFLSTVSALLCGAVQLHATIDVTLQMQLGNPSNATADTNNHNHYLIQRTVEAIDYSDYLGEPNWASWDYTTSDTGSSGRSGTFFQDTTLPNNFTNTVGPNDYSLSGWDRGHMCPSADRTDNVTDNDLVFYMSNIIPQAPNNNQIAWANFETFCRSNAGAGSGFEVLIICGPGGPTVSRIASGKVAVQTSVWKVAVFVPLGSGTALSRITTATRVIAIETPNTNGLSNAWQDFITSAGQIERDTGLTFFTAVPPTIASALRSKVDGLTEPVPTIASFSPGSGNTGTNVVITGNNFDSTSVVAFNGTNAVFSVDSRTQITAIVPANVTSGHISVTTPSGTATSAGSFSVLVGNETDLAVIATHSGTFNQGDTNDFCTVTVTNAGNTPFSGMVTISNALPAGLAATAVSAPGWTAGPNLSWTRSDSLPVNSAYPAISITVTVSAGAPLTETNYAYVSALNDTNSANNTAIDPISINPASAAVASTLPASAVGSTTVTLNGSVNPNNQPAATQFQYGLTTGYGTIISLGTFSGNSSITVSSNLTGLAVSTQYHYRLVSTNNLGGTAGADQTFTTTATGTPDLAIYLSHPGNFSQGDSADTLTISVTNVGTASSSGVVTVTNRLPPGMTVGGIIGTGWTLNTNTLTFTRSDSFAAGAGFPPITLTVSVASNAIASVTNVAGIAGGGDVNTANNTASDVITINPATNSVIVLAGWDVSALPGGVNNFGPSPLSPTTNGSNLAVTGFMRGLGVGTNSSGNPTAARAWGGNAFTNVGSANAIASNQFFTCGIAATAGYHVSFSAISKFDYRRSGTGPANGLLQYQVGAGPFIDVTAISYSSSATAGASLGPIDLSGISALQNVGTGTNVTFRIVNWGGGSSGTLYIFDAAVSSAPDFAVSGTVSANAPVLTPIESWRQQYFGTTNNTGSAADTAVASSDGMPNLLKYAFGYNPLVPTNSPLVGDISTGFLRLTLPRNPNATDISYYVEVSTDLTAASWTTSGTTIDQNTSTVLQVHYTTPVVASTRAFMRLRVTRP